MTCLSTNPLFYDIPQKQRVTNNIAAPHSFRFFQEPVEPFLRVLLPPLRCSFGGASIEVEHSTDGTAVAVDVKLIPMLVGPFLLFWSRHADPQQIGVCIVDGLYHRLIILIRELRFVRR